MDSNSEDFISAMKTLSRKSLETLQDDVARGDPTAIKQVKGLRGEINQALLTHGMLPFVLDETGEPCVLPSNVRLSRLILFGDEEFAVGLSNSQWLLIRLARFSEVAALPVDYRQENFRIDSAALSVEWPEQNLRFSLAQLAARADSIGAGTRSPK